jgi:hypothetical protein
MACGCPVVRMPDLAPGWRDRIMHGMMLDRARVRMMAEIQFDPAETARQYKAVLEEAMKIRPMVKAA